MPNPNPADTQPTGNPSDKGFTQETPEWWEEKLASLPAEDRDALISKIKGYDKGYKTLRDDYSRRMGELAEYEKEIKQVASDLKSVKPTTAPTASDKAAGKKLIDAWISKSEDSGDLQTAHTLKLMRDMIAEETNSSELRKQLQELQNTNKFLMEAYMGDKRAAFSSQLKELAKTYGDLVEKYEKPIKELSAQYPNLTPERLLWNVASEDEVRQALVVHSRRSGTDRTDTPRRGTVTGSEDKPIHERFKGKTPGDTARNYKSLVEEAVRSARERKAAMA